ncbi:MAG: UDP-galactopyranose mutase [Spirochaetaceae bacterium]|nr:UDP-galactopyranose mutase [Spirochaetaceae bacterium]
MNYDVIIVGAGLSGSTAARVLAEKGKKVLVVEKHRHVAGHCHDYRNEYGITVHTYGPHIFHTNDAAAWKFASRFTDFHFFQHRVLSYADGQLIPFPINADTINQVFGISIGVDEVEGFLASQVAHSSFNSPPKNFRDAVVSQIGKRLYSTFFEEYTRKQWGRDPELLSPEVAKRIPVRTNRDGRYFSDHYQGIPARGYTAMIDSMLDHPNISLMLGTDWFDIREDLDAKTTIFTGELDRFFDYKFGKLEYRSLDLVLKTLDQESYQNVAVVNYPNDYDWTRITEYKKFLDEKSPWTTVCFEYPKQEGEPFYVVMTDDNMAKRDKYMQEVEKLEASGSWLFIGRLAEYKYYNMDQVISATLQKVARL